MPNNPNPIEEFSKGKNIWPKTTPKLKETNSF